jgi:hypothetical protein
MRSKMSSQFLRVSIAAGAIAVALAGCYAGSHIGGTMPPPGTVMANGKTAPPNVWDCTMIQMSSPAKFACPPDGKTYNSFQLFKMRMDYEKQLAGGM